MVARTTVKITGLKELQDRIHELADDVAKKVIYSAALAAAQVVKKQAIENAQARGLVDTGALLRNIVNKRERSTRSGLAEYHVGVRHGQQKAQARKEAKQRKFGPVEQKTVDDPFYWRFLEFGTRNMSPKPFLAPAFDSKKEAALDAMVERLKTRIDKVGK